MNNILGMSINRTCMYNILIIDDDWLNVSNKERK